MYYLFLKCYLISKHLRNLFYFIILFIFIIIIIFTLQYCIGFAVHQHASTMGVHVRILCSSFSNWFLVQFYCGQKIPVWFQIFELPKSGVT